MKSKIILQVFAVILVCVCVFSGIVFVFSREELLGVDVPKSDVPYIDGRYIPDDSTVLIIFEDGSGAAVQLLFEKQMINLLLLKEATNEAAQIFGYEANHTLSCDYGFLIKFVDTLGGIELETGNGYALTGVQVSNLLAQEKGSSDTAEAIARGIFDKISKNGFSTDLLYCIIENTDTTLSSPACYGWVENLKYCASAYNIIDGR